VLDGVGVGVTLGDGSGVPGDSGVPGAAGSPGCGGVAGVPGWLDAAPTVTVYAVVVPLGLPAASHWIAWIDLFPAGSEALQDHWPDVTGLLHTAVPSTNTSTRAPASPLPPAKVVGWLVRREPAAGWAKMGRGGASLSTVSANGAEVAPRSAVPSQTWAAVTE
jgi:hypothetical protein